MGPIEFSFEFLGYDILGAPRLGVFLAVDGFVRFFVTCSLRCMRSVVEGRESRT